MPLFLQTPLHAFNFKLIPILSQLKFVVMKTITRWITAALLMTLFLIGIHQYNSRGVGLTQVGFKKGSFVDRTRERELKYMLWYPASHTFGAALTQEGPWMRGTVAVDAPIDLHTRDKFPLIMLSHGFDGSPAQQSWIAESLVKKGYIVCGIKHPDVEMKKVSPSYNRPLDASFVLSELLYSDFGQYIDQNKVGFMGFSLGTLTGLWLAGGITNLFDPGHFIPTKEFVHEARYFDYLKETRWEFDPFKKSYRDTRFKAFFLMAPSWGWVFSKEGLEKVKAPFFIIAPEGDNLVSTQSNAERYARLIPHSHLYLFNGNLSHFVFLNTIMDENIPEYDPAGEKRHLYEDLPGMARGRIHEKTVNLALEFFSTHLRG